ncbi:MAG: GAF domain-containing protein [Nitrospiraceae bacterium]|nr:GAF domain-containing protein [Nitrospiraceae bacterium]
MRYRVHAKDADLHAMGDGCAYDLSLGGVLLHTFTTLPSASSRVAKQHMRIDCHFPSMGETDVWCRGRVVWMANPIRSQNGELNQTFHAGVAFEQNGDTQSHIQRLLNFSPAYPSREQLASLLEISQLLTSSVELDYLLNLTLLTVKRLMRSEASSILLVDPITDELSFRTSSGPGSDQLKAVTLKPGQGIAGWVLKERRPALVNDVQKDSRFYSKVDILTGFKTRSILAIPLTYRDRTIGVIEALNTAKEKRFEHSDLELLSILAAHASVAIRTAQLVSSIKEENRYLQAELDGRYRTLIGESGP